jgi:hypothetical protein
MRTTLFPAHPHPKPPVRIHLLTDRLGLPSGPGNGVTVAYRFELRTVGGDDAGSIETSECNWEAGDTLITHGNREFGVVSVIPHELVAEFVVADGPRVGVLEVEQI